MVLRNLATLAALALVLSPTPTLAGTTKGRPADKYQPLTDWSQVAPFLRADPATIGQFEAKYAKVVSIAGRVEGERLLMRVRFERPIEAYFSALELDRLDTTCGVFLHLELDTDQNDRTGTPWQGPGQGTDLEVQISGSTGTDGTYRILGWYRALDEKGKPTQTKGSSRVDLRDIAYGQDAVEFAIPRSALLRAGAVVDVVVDQEVTVGDREVAVLRGTWTLDPRAASAAPAASLALATPAVPVGSAQQAQAAFARLIESLQKNDRALALAKIGAPEAKAALPALETLHGRMTTDNWKQDVADAIYKIKGMNGGGPN